jgi:hypothetical protein
MYSAMGSRGPVPKRSDQRRRANQDEMPIASAPAARKVTVPAAARTWHPIAKRWYLSLRSSGQSQFYESSDWMQAYVAAEVLSRLLSVPDKTPAMLFTAWSAESARLLVTEGDRRRLRIELEREGQVDKDEEAAVAIMAAYRDKRAQ